MLPFWYDSYINFIEILKSFQKVVTLLLQLENDSSVEIILNILNLKWHLKKKLKHIQ